MPILRGTVLARFLERQKPTVLTFKYRGKLIKTTKKKRKGFDRIWQIKTDENRQILCLNRKKFSTRGGEVQETIKFEAWRALY